jgi:hypothetical protein
VSPRITALFISLFIMSALRSAHAEDPVYGSMPAASCMPTRSTIEGARFATSSSGAVSFKPGMSGTMEFTCSLTFPPSLSPLAAHTYVQMHYANDADEASTSSYYARLQLRRRRKDTGSIEDVCSVYSSSAAVATTLASSCYFDSRDEEDYYFYANVTLFRDVATQTPSITVYGLSYFAQGE